MGKKRPRLLIKGTPVTKEPSRWHSGGATGPGGPGHFPSLSTHKMRSIAAAGMGEAHAMQREVARLSRTQPENRAAPIERHVITIGDVTFGLGLGRADEQRIQMLVSTTSPEFSQKTQTPRLLHAKSRLLSVLRDAMKHVSADTREEVVKRAMAYWKRTHQTDYGKGPTIRFRGGETRKSMTKLVIPKLRRKKLLVKAGPFIGPKGEFASDPKGERFGKSLGFFIAKSFRGGKYIKRVPTGNPKRPWKYYYSQAQYDLEHPGAAEKQHISGGRAKKTRALTKLKKQIKQSSTVKNGIDQAVPVSDASRIWVESGVTFGLPASTVDVHVKRITGRNSYGEPIREYTRERTVLHDRLVSEATKHVKRTPKGQRPVAVVMMGGGGAGKGTLIKSVIGDHKDFVHVDPDDVKEKMPEYQEAIGISTVSGKPVTARDAAWMAHEESSDIGEKILKKGIENRQNLIVDGTGKTATKHADKIKALKAAGYQVRLLYAHAEMTDAVKRAASRADRKGRYVPHEVLVDAHTKIPGNFEFVARHADSFDLFLSDRPPKVLWSGSRGSPDTIHEAAEVKAFKRLGRRLHKERNIKLPPIPKDLLPGKGQAVKSFDAALDFWDLSKAEDPPSISSEELYERIRTAYTKYPPETTDENTTEGMDDELREAAKKSRNSPMLVKSCVSAVSTNMGTLMVYRPPRRIIDLEWK